MPAPVSTNNDCAAAMRAFQLGRRILTHPALPARLEQAHAGGHRHVEALHRAVHRDAHQRIAARARELAQALALGAEHQRQRAAQVGLVQRLLAHRRRCRRRGCRAPSAPRCSATGWSPSGTARSRPRRWPPWPPCALMPTAWSFGAITACAPAPSATRRQAPRLCGSVTPSSTSSSGAPCTSSSTSSIVRALNTASTRATTPWWWCVPHRLLQTRVVAVDQARAGFLRAHDELPHARVAARRIDMDLEHRLRRGLQPHGDGMEAEQHLTRRHGAHRSLGRRCGWPAYACTLIRLPGCVASPARSSSMLSSRAS